MGVAALPKTISFAENLLLVSAVAASGWLAYKTRAAAKRDLTGSKGEPGARWVLLFLS